ncbi:transposase family protein [Streptomyces netropsis]
MLLDGALAECYRTSDGRADYSGNHRRHEVNLQVVTAPVGALIWISPVLPGRPHDLTTARRPPAPDHHHLCSARHPGHRGPRLPGCWRHRRRPPPAQTREDLTLKQKCLNRAHSRLRWPVEKDIASIETWRPLRKARCHPTGLTSITKAVLTLETRC